MPERVVMITGMADNDHRTTQSGDIVDPQSISRAMSKLIVWHDGACPLCRREIALMRRLDRCRAIRFVDVTTTHGSACPIDRAELLARFHASEDGTLLSGAAAFAAMWRAIPLLRPIGMAARVPMVLTALEFCYRVFLRVRPRLQRLAARARPA